MIGTCSIAWREESLSTRDPDDMRNGSLLLVSKRDLMTICGERVGLAGASYPFAVVSCDPSEV